MNQPTTSSQNSSSQDKAGLRTVGTVLGGISLIAWLIPLFGFAFSITGLILAKKGAEEGASKLGEILSTVGIVLSSAGFLFGILLYV